MLPTPTEHTLHAAQSLDDIESHDNPYQIHIKVVQIDLRKSHYINPKVSIHFDGRKHESNWLGFRKYDQICWEPEQTRDISKCDNIKISWRIRCPLRAKNSREVTLSTQEILHGTFTRCGHSNSIEKTHVLENGECKITVTLTRRENIHKPLVPGSVQGSVVDAQQQATQTISLIDKTQSPLSPNTVHDAATDAEQIKSVRDRLGASIVYLEGVSNLGDFISELHPALGISVGILTGVIKILNVEDTRNKEIIQLIVSMSDIVDYVVDVEQFATVAQLKAVIGEANDLMQKTVKFFNEHRERGIFKKAFAAFSPSAKEELEGLQAAFDRFKEKFDRGMAVQTTVSVSSLESQFRALVRANEDDKVLELLDTKHVTRALRCLEGTREDFISFILEWARDFAESVRNVLWIYGYPGAGKSTLAMHIAMLFRTQHRLGVIVEFNRTAGITPVILCKIVAYALAREYPVCREVIVSELKSGTLDLSNTTSSEIFNRVVAEPLRRLTASHSKISHDRLPIVVIDALDECGGWDGSSRQARKEILNCVAEWAKLAPGVKLVITSRAEQDIKQAFSAISHTPLEIQTGSSVTGMSTHDIRLYMEDEFKRIAKDNEITGGWPGDEIVTDLARRAEGIFIWATTVISFINDGVPTRQLNVVLNERLPSGNVYRLYRQILESSFPQTYSLECFKKVVSAVIVAQQQFAPTELGELLELEVDEINDIRKRLRTVLDDVDVVRFKHQSFVDFLLSASSSDPTACPERFCINVVDAHGLMVESLFRLMNKTLRFNICQIPSSSLRNDQLPPGHVESMISRPLAYACRFWGSHLENQQSMVNVDLVNTFVFEHLLSWLEVLSVHESLPVAVPFFTRLADRLPVSIEQSASLKVVINDAISFIGFCGQAIAVSASHIYTSALAFAPESSKIVQLYAPRFKNTIGLDVGRFDKWPAKKTVIRGHTSRIEFVAFSPDGRQVVSCSSDRTVRTCDVETGQSTAGPFEGHTDTVLCAVYSADGKSILSASTDGTVRMWNTECGIVDEHVTVLTEQKVYCAIFSPSCKYIALAHSGQLYEEDCSYYISIRDVETGEIVSGPFFGHDREITCLSYSPDEMSVASGSEDRTIGVWDTRTGKPVVEPLEGHLDTVGCISYSHNSAVIVSGSDDCTIKLWEVGKTPPQVRAFKGLKDWVGSVTFSSDDRWIVSGSFGGAILVWDVNTGHIIAGPFEGANGPVLSVTISVDGKRVASGSSDLTVCIWDVETDQERCAFLDGLDVSALALSNDRKYIASGSEDGTIQNWDLRTGQLVGSLCKGYRVAVLSLAYSPDGKHVVSGCSDGTIRIFEVASERGVKELHGSQTSAYSTTFSNNGRCVASISRYGTIRIWDIKTGECVYTSQVQSGGVSQVAFSPDDEYVLSGWQSGFRIWDIKTGSLVTESKQQHDREVVSVAFSHDGRLVVTGSCDNTIRLWDATNGEQVLGPFIGHTGTVCSVAFSPDDLTIASGSEDETVRVWNVMTGQTILGPLTGHIDRIDLVAFSHNGNSIFSASRYDKTVRTWSTEQIQPPFFTNESVIDDDGWFKGGKGELLFWAPIHHRLSLHRPSNTRIIGPNETRINFKNARWGNTWTECYTP